MCLATFPAHAQTLRTFAGGTSTRWNTIGHHGHDQAAICITDECDADDFARANLDDSIGFRAGIERDLWSAGALHLVGGSDVSIGHTEYNLSQRDFSIVSATAFGGADVQLGGVRIGARYGAGGYATTNAQQSGLIRYLELAATAGPVRIARRDFGRMRDISIMLVSSDATPRWEFSAATGTTMPGAGAGGDRKLRSTALNRMTATRGHFELSWTSTAHESSEPSIFRGYDGNFRSKTINGYGLAFTRSHAWTDALSMRWSGGVEVADWRDEHRLLTRNGEELVAGVELALTAGAAVRLRLQPRLAFETSLQKLYWRGIDLGELRWTAGIVLTR